MKISIAARLRASEQRDAHLQERIANEERQARLREQEQQRSSTIAVRFGPSPASREGGDAGADAAVREALSHRAQLPRVGSLLQHAEASHESSGDSARAGAADEQKLMGGGDDAGVDLDLMGDGERVSQGDASPDARPEPALREVLPPRPSGPEPELTLPGSGELELVRQEASGETRERSETEQLQRSDSPEELQAVAAAVPGTGGAQNAQSQASSLGELPGTDAGRSIDRDQLARQAATLNGVVEATQQDQLVTRYLGRTDAPDPGPEPRAPRVLGTRG